jgi:hypothetical protein
MVEKEINQLPLERGNKELTHRLFSPHMIACVEAA